MIRFPSKTHTATHKKTTMSATKTDKGMKNANNINNMPLSFITKYHQAEWHCKDLSRLTS